MRRALGYILTPLFYICFAVSLLIFHPIQWLCFKLGGYTAHKKSVDLLNGVLVACNYVLFNRTRFVDNKSIPTGRPIIFVANHQSTFDIPPMIYFLRRFHGKFISKIELAKAGIPSISYNLIHGGAANKKLVSLYFSGRNPYENRENETFFRRGDSHDLKKES